jgi:flavin-dependent dehydrogenase
VTRRATLRGAERTSLDGEWADVLVCGASFAGLAIARELAGSGADVLLVDRYEVESAPPLPALRRAHGSKRWAWLAQSGKRSPA